MGLSTRIFTFGLMAAAASLLCAAPPAGSRGGVRAAAAPSHSPAPLGLGRSYGFTGINPGALNSRGAYGHGYRRLPVSYFFAPYYYPGLGYGAGAYDSGGYGYDAAAAQGQDPNADGLTQGQYALGAQIAQLQEQVAGLGAGQQQPSYPAPQASAPPTPPQPPVTLVLRSGQHLRVQNFAVMGQTFWDFTSQPTRKIPVEAIDIPASTQATEAQGGEFPSLTGGE